jgi:hypothetical protein
VPAADAAMLTMWSEGKCQGNYIVLYHLDAILKPRILLRNKNRNLATKCTFGKVFLKNKDFVIELGLLYIFEIYVKSCVFDAQ